jgi:hypothetical protein
MIAVNISDFFLCYLQLQIIPVCLRNFNNILCFFDEYYHHPTIETQAN